MLAKHALSQLSYGPKPPTKPRSDEPKPAGRVVVGLGRLELPTSRLSSARSNQLSYKPEPAVIVSGGRSHETTTMTTTAGEGSSEEEKETKAAASRMMPLDKRG